MTIWAGSIATRRHKPMFAVRALGGDALAFAAWRVLAAHYGVIDAGDFR